jgi:amino acid adenylation domain-containing protein
MIENLTGKGGNVYSKSNIDTLEPDMLNTNLCVHQLFEQQVVKTPDNVALVFADNTYTYLELNTKVNQLASRLTQQYTITPDKIIGIMLNRSDKMVLGVLAILKAGGAYLPLDQNIPAARNAFICADAAVDIILTDNIPVNRSSYPDIDFIDLNSPEAFAGDNENPVTITNTDNLGYVIFTSGSTGNPKGVLIEHRSVVNFLNDNINRYNVGSNDIVLGLNSFFFDVSIWELFIPLVTGACLCMLEPEAHKYPERIFEACADKKITIFFLTPVVLQLFLSYLEVNPGNASQLTSLRKVIAGGEVITPKLVNLFNKLLYREIGTRLSNIYGPTETTVWVTVFECESDYDVDIVPIGKPISNTEIYVLDSEGNLLPDGEAGELVVGGVPVARGYLNRPELDGEMFVKNPYRRGEKMYRTGDMGRYMPNGNIEFLGRIDNQVKLNGFRIELYEIENVVLRNTHIKECVVLMRNINDANELVVYYTLTSNGPGENSVKDVLTTDLPKILPGYMVPSFYVELSAFPINTNGKINRNNLPLPLQRYHQRVLNFTPPNTVTGKKIAAILIENLKIENIGIDDNIFDLGVKSLMVTKVILQIESTLGLKLTLPAFFQLPTIRQLGNYIDHNHGEVANSIILLRKGSGNPFFMLPGAYSDALTFVNFLNNYKISQPLYSVSYPEDKNFSAFESISAYASYLVTQIKQVQPQGPYNFLGYSLGGSIAFEIALQLQQAGDEVDLLALISADAPIKKSLISNQILAREFSFLLRPNFYLLKKYLKYRFPFLFKRFINKFVSKKMGIHIPFSKANTIKLVERHRSTQKFKGDMLLITEDIKKSHFFNFAIGDPYTLYIMEDLWKSHVTGKVTCLKMTCAHSEIFSEALVHNITGVIEKHFENAALI